MNTHERHSKRNQQNKNYWYPREEKEQPAVVDNFAESAPDNSKPNPDTGGQAFPSNQDISNEQKYLWMEGMTLRDYFAAAALQGFMANKSNPLNFLPEEDAQYAYAIADAMIKARQ